MRLAKPKSDAYLLSGLATLGAVGGTFAILKDMSDTQAWFTALICGAVAIYMLRIGYKAPPPTNT